jgi:hypothetical protein
MIDQLHAESEGKTGVLKNLTKMYTCNTYGLSCCVQSDSNDS